MVDRAVPERYRPGEKASQSGEYAILDSAEREVGVRYVTAGDPFPPTPSQDQTYVLRRVLVTVYTTASSAAVIDETAHTLSEALKRLEDS